MDRLSLLAALERDGTAFADSCAAAGLQTPVVSCPGWNVADLVWHLGEVHHFWRTIVRDGMSSYEGYLQPDRPAVDGLLDFYNTGFSQTVHVLGDADPTASVWTWSSDHTAGFVLRRMAHETAMHRWDADRAAERDMPVEAALASDGIDEFLQHFAGDSIVDSPPVGGSVHLHCTDVAGEWLVTQHDQGFTVVREHAKGDAAIRGAASDILLALWRRQPLSDADVIGDHQVAARLVASTKLD